MARRAPLLLPLAALSQRISLWFGTFSCPAPAQILGGTGFALFRALDWLGSRAAWLRGRRPELWQLEPDPLEGGPRPGPAPAEQVARTGGRISEEG